MKHKVENLVKCNMQNAVVLYYAQCILQYLMCKAVCNIYSVSVVGLVISVPGSFLLSHLIDERAERTA